MRSLAARSLRTRPLADGMRIEQLQTRAPQAAHRCQRRLARPRRSGAHAPGDCTIDSDDFGALLAGFGYRRPACRAARARRVSTPAGPAARRVQPGALDGTLDARRRAMAADGTRTRRRPRARPAQPGAAAAPADAGFPRFLLQGLRLQPASTATCAWRTAWRAATTCVIDGPAARDPHQRRRRPARADLRPDHRGAAQGRQPADRGRRDRRRPGRRRDRRGRQCGAEEAAGTDSRAKTYRVTGPWKEPEGRGDRPRASRASRGAIRPQVDPTARPPA